MPDSLRMKEDDHRSGCPCESGNRLFCFFGKISFPPIEARKIYINLPGGTGQNLSISASKRAVSPKMQEKPPIQMRGDAKMMVFAVEKA